MHPSLPVFFVANSRERRAIPACIQQNHLDASFRWAKRIGCVNSSVAQPPFAVGRLAPKIKKDFSGAVFGRVVTADVIEAVVVVIPGGDDRRRGAQALKAGLCGEQRIGATQFIHIGRIAVHVVAQKDEQVRRTRQDGIPDRLRFSLPGARAKGDDIEGGRLIQRNVG